MTLTIADFQLSAVPARASAVPVRVSAVPARVSAAPARVAAVPAWVSAAPARVSALTPSLSFVTSSVSSLPVWSLSVSSISSFFVPIPSSTSYKGQRDRFGLPSLCFLILARPYPITFSTSARISPSAASAAAVRRAHSASVAST